MHWFPNGKTDVTLIFLTIRNIGQGRVVIVVWVAARNRLAILQSWRSGGGSHLKGRFCPAGCTGFPIRPMQATVESM